MNVPTSTRGIWLNPAGDAALTMGDLDYLDAIDQHDPTPQNPTKEKR